MHEFMIVGEYEVAVDAKKRVAIPSRLRPAFSEGLVVTAGDEGCLAVYTPGGFEHLLESRSEGISPWSSSLRGMERLYSSQAVHQMYDSQGRVVLSARHLAHAGIEREATIIGVRDHLEIWDRERWIQYFTNLKEEADATADKLAAS